MLGHSKRIETRRVWLSPTPSQPKQNCFQISYLCLIPPHFLKPLLEFSRGVRRGHTKQKGKKQGKGTMNPCNGFASVDSESGWDSSIVKAWLTEIGLSSGANCQRFKCSKKGLIFLSWLGAVATSRVCVPFSVPQAAEFVVHGSGEQVDAAIVDSDCIGAECGSGNRKALVL
jgi:hypothetical protein